MDIPYMDFREAHELEPKLWLPYPANCNENDRIRVYSTQLMDEIIENINSSNYLYQVSVYYIIGDKLLKRFPHREEDISKASIVIWERTQSKLKLLKSEK